MILLIPRAAASHAVDVWHRPLRAQRKILLVLPSPSYAHRVGRGHHSPRRRMLGILQILGKAPLPKGGWILLQAKDWGILLFASFYPESLHRARAVPLPLGKGGHHDSADFGGTITSHAVDAWHHPLQFTGKTQLILRPIWKISSPCFSARRRERAAPPQLCSTKQRAAAA